MKESNNVIVICNEEHVIVPGKCALCERDQLQSDKAELLEKHRLLVALLAQDTAMQEITRLRNMLAECITDNPALAERNHSYGMRRLNSINEIAWGALAVVVP